jgi:hypothetical protein
MAQVRAVIQELRRQKAGVAAFLQLLLNDG